MVREAEGGPEWCGKRRGGPELCGKRSGGLSGAKALQDTSDIPDTFTYTPATGIIRCSIVEKQ